MVSAGSPGIRWTKLKTRTETPRRTGMTVTLRRMAYCLIYWIRRRGASAPDGRADNRTPGLRRRGPSAPDGRADNRTPRGIGPYWISTMLKYSEPVGCGTYPFTFFAKASGG